MNKNKVFILIKKTSKKMTLRVVKSKNINRTQWVSNLLLKKVVNINNKAHNTVNLFIFMCDCFTLYDCLGVFCYLFFL